MSAPHPAITQRQALEALWSYGQPGEWCPLDRLAKQAGVPEKVALCKIMGLVRKGYAEYGVSAVYAWRTPEGERRLASLPPS